MQTLYIHLSALIGLFAFVNQLVRYAPLDRTILVGVASGVSVYVVLILGEVIIKRIIENQGAQNDERHSNGAPASGTKPEEPPKQPSGTEPSAQAA
jgi:hypothetical protein